MLLSSGHLVISQTLEISPPGSVSPFPLPELLPPWVTFMVFRITAPWPSQVRSSVSSLHPSCLLVYLHPEYYCDLKLLCLQCDWLKQQLQSVSHLLSFQSAHYSLWICGPLTHHFSISPFSCPNYKHPFTCRLLHKGQAKSPSAFLLSFTWFFF